MRRIIFVGKFFVGVVLCFGAISMFGSPKAHANHVPVAGGIPQNLRTYLSNDCGHSGQSPSLVQWVSAQGAPTTLTINVPYGAASAPLRLNLIGMVCYPNSAVPETRLGNLGASGHRYTSPTTTVPFGSVSGVQGAVLPLPFNAAYQAVGYTLGGSRNFNFNAPAGGFTQSGVYRVVLDNRVINRFSGGGYGCVATGGGNPGGWNYGNCAADRPGFNIQINVAPAPVNRGACSISGPVSVYPGESFTAGFRVDNTSYGGNPSSPGVVWPLSPTLATRYRLNAVDSNFPGRPAIIEITGPGVDPALGGILFPPGHGHPNTTSWNRTFSSPTTGQYIIQYRIWNGSAEIARCSHTVNVVERPYHKVYSGDVFAGAAFAGTSGGQCYDPNARIIGRAGGFGYTGASTQLAAFALGNITEFGTRQSYPPDGVPGLKALTFSNTGGDPAWGGDLGNENAVCAADYWADATNIQGDDYPVNGRNLGMGQRQTIYVDGDAYISGSITYANGNYNGIGQIPSFRLIVRGNIYIGPGATELNGLYVAIPTNANNGRVYTCSNGTAPPTQAQLNPGGACNNRLTVYGGIVADLIKFTRTGGSTRHSTVGENFDFNSGVPVGGQPAEVFIYSPESWLSSDFNSGGEVDAIRTLPPVL